MDTKPGRDYIGVGGGVLIANGKKEILLMKRGKNAKNEAGFWAKPGGSIEYGEKAAASMKREVKEELDVEIEITGLLPHTDHFVKKEKQHWIAINMVGRIKKGTPKIMEPHKCVELKWFPLDKLPRKISQATKEGISYYRDGNYIKL
jgi:8-oxo-dGTP diphosphatase